jgi:hypothetical protein
MANTFLINAPHNQNVKTKEGYDGWPIVYSNPVYYETKKILAADFGLVQVNDELIICSDSCLKYMYRVSRIEMLTDASGSKNDRKPVKVVFGKKTSTFLKISVSVACNRLSQAGIATPNLISPRGFKQGAFAELLNSEQTEEITKWATQ